MPRILRFILIGALVLLVALVALMGFFILTDSLGGESAEQYTNVTYPAADGTTLRGYVSQPPGDAAPLAAVIMVHEWWGLNGEIVEMADKLAAEGYVVLAPDTYRGNLATSVPGALYLRITAPAERVDSDMQAAFDYLAGLPNVDPSRIGVMGFCYGGGVALRHAIDNPEIAGTINLYGDTVDDPAAFGALLESGRSVLGIFGERDQQIPVSEVEAFERALADANIPHEVTIYPEMPHAFVNPAGIAAGGAPADAWAQILDYWRATLAVA
jgi:carboxymethylenebutenolidase